jgi:hypothetical protein
LEHKKGKRNAKRHLEIVISWEKMDEASNVPYKKTLEELTIKNHENTNSRSKTNLAQWKNKALDFSFSQKQRKKHKN